MKQYTIGVFVLVSFLMPLFATAQVRFNEVAWMGTAASQFGEWVEFYNDSDTEVDLAGAGLFEGGGKTLVITLTKKIAPHGFLLVERVTPSVPDPVPSISDEAGSFAGGGFSNSGEFLLLKDKNGTTLDQIDFSGGWPAGDNDTKATMQFDGTKWVTGPATPDAPTPTGIAAPSGGGGGSSLQSTASLTDSSSNNSSSSSSKSSSSSSGSVTELSSHASPIPLSLPHVEEPDMVLETGRERLGFVGKPLSFETKVLTNNGKEELTSFDYRWVFGDGGAGNGKTIDHTYQFPGEYNVVVTGVRGPAQVISRMKVHVVSPAIVFGSIVGGPNSVIELRNTSGVEVNIGDAQLITTGHIFIFPEDTIVGKGQSLFVATKLTGIALDPGSPLTFSMSDGTVVSRTALPAPVVTPFTVATATPVITTVVTPALLKIAPLSITPVSLPRAISQSQITLRAGPILPPTPTSTKIVVAEIPHTTGGVSSILALPARAWAFVGSLFGK